MCTVRARDYTEKWPMGRHNLFDNLFFIVKQNFLLDCNLYSLYIAHHRSISVYKFKGSLT